MLTPEQLELRKTGIGGSEIGAVLGESPFASPFDVWLAKTQGWTVPETEDMRRGTYLEDGIGRWYQQRYAGEVTGLVEPSTIRHATVPVALCTPDRIAETDEGGRLVSIKSPRRKGDHWGEPGTSQVPPGYALQLQWEHAIVSSHGPISPVMHLAALLDGDLCVYVIVADAELQAWMLESAQAWWARHVVGGVAPSMDGSGSASAWLKRRFPRDESPMRPASPWEDLRMLALRDAEAEHGRWADEVDTMQSELKQSIGVASGIESPAGRVTWKADRNGKRSFKTKWTKEKHHE